jgi:hypothetical protein
LSVHSFDFDKQMVRVAFMFPTLQFNGHYEMAGNLVGLPIAGKGDYELFLSKCYYHYYYERVRSAQTV